MIVVNKVRYYFDESETKYIKSKMRELKITQNELCKKYHVGVVKFSLVINGKRPINDKIVKILKDVGIFNEFKEVFLND